MADSPRNLFLPHQNRPKGNPKNIGFWRRSFPHFFRCWKKWGRRRQKPEKSDPHSEARNIPFAAGGINRKIGGAGPRRFASYFSRMAAKNALSRARLS